MRFFFFLLILFVMTSFTYAQEKKTAALAPLASMGDIDEIQKKVIFNSLQESISKYYALSSQKMYEKAEEEAFQQMDADECTEDQCIAIIQELLQVEYFFMFEILQTGNFQQLKLTRVDLDNQRDVRTITCEECSIAETNSIVGGLVLDMDNAGLVIAKTMAPTASEEKQVHNVGEDQNPGNTAKNTGADFFNCGPGKMFSDSKALISTTNTYSWWIYSSATSSGTSECGGNVYASDDIKVRFIATNSDVLLEQSSIGNGPHLEALSVLMGCDRHYFGVFVHEHYQNIFIQQNGPSEILSNLEKQISLSDNMGEKCFPI